MNELEKRASAVIEKINIEDKKYKLKEIEAQSMMPDFWKDSQKATEKMKEMASLQKEIDKVNEL